MTEKRIIGRLKKRLTIRFGIDSASRVAFSEDLSATGMFIKTANVCPPNSRIRIEFTVDDHLVQVDARVMWAKKVPQNLFHLVKKSGMGVRFLRFQAGEEHFQRFLGAV
ncbi:pilus assembly protein PilZ [Geobacter sp. FeAm09]|uniref:PilZ domain-containing protein n=1 Tax=Geobacter sp. FeAm09 TaxID=2597769 RepID=UPI0011EBABFC|nr:PilZ domain-containing protein [Geobacter sp. FeAm09]QEM69636.1 pilus assembly protein PilZ [Geobacter sp. FeAm09]